MKPWEETWDERGECIDLCEEQKPYGMVSVKAIATFYCTEGDCSEAARARLAAAAPEMARLLVELEWSGLRTYEYEGGGDPVCPVCDQEPTHEVTYPAYRKDAYTRVEARTVTEGGHTPDCRLVAVLRKAGVID